MNTEVLARSPVLIAALATVVALIGVGRESTVPGAGDSLRDSTATVTIPAPAAGADVPLIGELTVVAERNVAGRG